jgi:hypothetical protein
MSSHEKKPTTDTSSTSNSVNGQGDRTVNGGIQRRDNQGQSESRDQPSTTTESIVRPMSDAEKKELGLE